MIAVLLSIFVVISQACHRGNRKPVPGDEPGDKTLSKEGEYREILESKTSCPASGAMAAGQPSDMCPDIEKKYAAPLMQEMQRFEVTEDEALGWRSDAEQQDDGEECRQELEDDGENDIVKIKLEYTDEPEYGEQDDGLRWWREGHPADEGAHDVEDDTQSDDQAEDEQLEHELEHEDLPFIMYRWRSHIRQLLSRIRSFPVLGKPGRLVLYQPSAAALVTGSEMGEVVVAAGQVGEGRIVVLSQDIYIKNIRGGHAHQKVARFQQNMLQWVTGNGDEKEVKICVLSRQRVPVKKQDNLVFVWHGGNIEPEEEQRVEEMVMAGQAGLLYGVRPWHWKNNNDLDRLPLANLLKKTGIWFAENQLKSDNLEMIPGYSMSQKHNLCHAIDALLDNNSSLASQAECLLHCLIWVPVDDSNTMSRLQGLAAKFSEELRQCGPTKKSPVDDQEGRALMAICQTLYKHRMGVIKLPGTEEFPGDFSTPPPLVSAEVDVKAKFKGSHPLGYYLPAGYDLHVTLLSQKPRQGEWKLCVGVHTDTLKARDTLIRWPKLVTTVILQQDVCQVVRSPFGGSLRLLSPATGGRVNVRLSGVVEAPLYDTLDKRSISSWPTWRNAPGLWADISGRYITFSLSADSVRDVTDPGVVMETWDRVVAAHHHLRGTDPDKQKRQWVVTDIQTSMGWLHSGYPIVTHLASGIPDHKLFLLNHERLQAGEQWGMFHELGHNMQRSWWTFQGTIEVTCNIFTLHAMDVICGQSAWMNSKMIKNLPKVRSYLCEGADFTAWRKSSMIALVVYTQLSHVFGWKMYKEVFRYYEALNPQDLSDADKISLWIERCSASSRHNLAPLFDFWGFPVDTTLLIRLAEQGHHLFLPDDEITTLAPDHTKAILHKYPGCLRHTGEQ